MMIILFIIAVMVVVACPEVFIVAAYGVVALVAVAGLFIAGAVFYSVTGVDLGAIILNNADAIRILMTVGFFAYVFRIVIKGY